MTEPTSPAAVTEPIALKVHRRQGRLWVAIYVRSQSLADLFGAEPNVESLTRALVRADVRARQEIALPESERYRKGREYWREAGCKTWEQFVRGLTSCDVTRWPPGMLSVYRAVLHPGTTVEYWVPDPERPGGLTATDFIENHPRDISYEELARIVLRVFATYPPDSKVPVRSR